MASPLTWRWSWNPTDSAFTTSLPTSSILYFSLTNRNRNHLTRFSLDQNQNPTQSSSNKSKSIESASSLLKDDQLLTTQVSIGEIKSTENEVRLKPLKRYLFSKGPLWRRILFASKKARSIMLLNVLALVYASNIPVVKEVEAIIDPAVFSLVRFTVTAIPFIPFMLRARGDLQIRVAGIELGIWVSLGYLLEALGLLTSDVGRASFISIFTLPKSTEGLQF